MFSLAGKKALITGASGGIGAAIAAAFHQQGAELVLTGTRQVALDQLAETLGSRATVLTADLGDPAAAASLVERAEAAVGAIDILVNNAGLTRDGLIIRMKDEDWQLVLDVNLTAGFPSVAGGFAWDDETAVWANYWHQFGCWGYWQSWSDQLCCGQGGDDRVLEGFGAGGCSSEHHRQLHCAGLYCYADDRRIDG